MGWGSALELRDPDGYRVIVYRLGPSPFAADGLGA
jgi:hypothetical protein